MSINLPLALQSTFSIPGVGSESDVNAAVTSVAVNYLTGILSITVQQGSTSGQNFSPGQYPPSYIFNVNLITGNWMCNGTALSGTLSGTPFATNQAAFLNMLNMCETFALAQGLFPAATTTAWTSLSGAQ